MNERTQIEKIEDVELASVKGGIAPLVLAAIALLVICKAKN